MIGPARKDVAPLSRARGGTRANPGAAHPFRPLATLAEAEMRIIAQRRLGPLGLTLAPRLWPQRRSAFAAAHERLDRLHRVLAGSIVNARARSALDP